MKTKISTIYLFLVFAFLAFTGCSKDGAQGPAGVDGKMQPCIIPNGLVQQPGQVLPAIGISVPQHPI